jgi:predicted secreted protein
MKSSFLLVVIALLASLAVSAQSKPNDAMAKQIKALKADKVFTLTYDQGSGMSKVMGSSESFTGAEAKKAGIQAMSFGTAFFYQGQALAAVADPIALTFWVMTKKPQFAANHKWTAMIGTETLDLGDAQYAAKPANNMEYLNFQVSRESLKKLTGQGGVKFKLGTAEFEFSASQMKLLANLLKLSDPG